MSIDKRPDIVEEKSRIGDFEGDLITGEKHKGKFVTLVDRCSKCLLTTQVPDKNVTNVKAKIIELLIPHKSSLHTIIFDNRKEFARHGVMATEL